MEKNKLTIVFGLYVLIMLLLVTTTTAQGTVNALYITAEDFQHNQLIDVVPTDQHNRIEQQLGKKLLVYRKGETKKYAFGDVYGYYQDGAKYRAWSKRKWFSGYGYYQVLDDSGLMIYSKRSEHHRANGYTWYYYSLSATSEIKRLTEDNIQKDFSAYPRFVQVVSGLLKKNEVNLKSDEGLLIGIYFKQMVKDTYRNKANERKNE